MMLNSLLHFLQDISALSASLGGGGGPLSRGKPRPSAILPLQLYYRVSSEREQQKE
jgi:hypothetical protein